MNNWTEEHAKSLSVILSTYPRGSPNAKTILAVSEAIDWLRHEHVLRERRYKRLLDAVIKAASTTYLHEIGCDCSACNLYRTILELSKEGEGSAELDRDQISKSDLTKLTAAAQEMVELGTTPPAPISKVRAGQTVAICHHCDGTGLHPTEAWSCSQCGATGTLLIKADGINNTWSHAANEWADVAINGVQWIKNIRDGFSTCEQALLDMAEGIDHCRSTQPKGEKS